MRKNEKNEKNDQARVEPLKAGVDGQDLPQSSNEESPWLLLLQEFYDATTQLQAVMAFTYTAEDLLSPEHDEACRRLMQARAKMRRSGLIEHRDAGLLVLKPLDAPFDTPAAAVLRRATDYDG